MRARLEVARWLVAAGAGSSARAVLGELRGAEPNDLRVLAARAILAPGVYALVVLEGTGLVVPARAAVGAPRVEGESARLACQNALAAVYRWLGVRRGPALRLELEQHVELDGASIGLPAALAFAAHVTGRLPARAVLATGAVNDAGLVHAVGQLPEKLDAAARERGDTQVIAPTMVATVDAALRDVFGDDATVDATTVGLDEILERSRLSHDPARAIDMLEAVGTSELTEPDRARYLLELGTALRHAGRTAEARTCHAQARALLRDHGRVVGLQEAERYELELWLTAMDEFRLERCVSALAARVREPFLSAHNELRCRGMLAQALAMDGRFVEAVEVRRANVPLHAASAELGRTLAGTLVYLTLDSARAGDAAAYERWGRDLVAASHDEHQWRYSAHALLRGAVALGRMTDAIAWANGRGALVGVRAPRVVTELVEGSRPITTHPESTTARALVRALRRTDALGPMRRLVERVTVDGQGLEAWVRVLVHLEGALVGAQSRAALIERLVEADPRATGYHANLRASDPRVVEAALDRVFY